MKAERNKICALKMSKSRYSWLFGDKRRLLEGAVDTILNILSSHDLDLMIINRRRRVNDIKNDALYSDPNKLLSDLAWHMTLVSSSIFSSELISKGNFDKYLDTDFVHLGVIFDYYAGKRISAYWHAEPLFRSVKHTIAWQKETFDIFITKWIALIQSLPASYSKEAKLKAIKDHGIKSGLFDLEGFLGLRVANVYDFKVFQKYFKAFPLVTNVPISVLFLVSIFPRKVLSIFFRA